MALWISTSWDIIYQITISSGKYKPILNACSFVSNWAKIVEMLFVPRVKVYWYIMISSSWFMHRSKIYFCHFRCLLGTASPTCIITQYAPSLTSMVQLNPLYNCVCIFFLYSSQADLNGNCRQLIKMSAQTTCMSILQL